MPPHYLVRLLVVGFVLLLALAQVPLQGSHAVGQSRVRANTPAQVAASAELPPHPLLSDLTIRRALAYCTDRRALLDSVYPYLTPDGREALLMDTFLPKSHWAYHAPPPQHQYPFDPVMGSQLLEAAGWSLADGALYRRNAGDYELVVKLTTTDAQFRQAWAERLEEQWRTHCGVRLLRSHIPANIWFGSATGLARREFELGALAWVGQADPGGESLYSCDQIPSAANRWEGQNYMGWCNPTASDAIVVANNRLVRAERIAAYRIVQEEFARDMVSLPLFQRFAAEAWSIKLAGVRVDPTEYTTASAAAWTRTDEGDTLTLAFSQEPASMHSLVESSAAQAQIALMAVGVPNTQYNYDYQPVLQKELSTLESGLAISKMVGGLPQLTVTYSLNPYTWSDGTPGSIEDVKLAYAINCDPNSGATTFILCDSIEKIEYSDSGDLSWTVTYLPGSQSPDYHVMPFSISPKAPIYPSHQQLDDGRKLVDVPAEEWSTLPEITETPLSYGPFYITEWIKGQSMTLQANPHYAPGTGVQTITILFDAFINPASLLSGHVDFLERGFLGGGAEVQTVMEAAAEGKVNAQLIPSPTWEHLDMNLNLYTQAVARVLPVTGGEANSAVGLSLTVPAGVLTSTATVIINDLSTPSQSLRGTGTPVRAFSLDLLNASGEPVTAFAQPLTLTIEYTDEQLSSLNEQTLNVVRWNDETWVKLLPCDGCGVDAATNRVTVRLDHLSEFALTGQSLLYVPTVRP